VYAVLLKSDGEKLQKKLAALRIQSGEYAYASKEDRPTDDGRPLEQDTSQSSTQKDSIDDDRLLSDEEINKRYQEGKSRAAISHPSVDLAERYACYERQ
jgi:hypothetical protein